MPDSTVYSDIKDEYVTNATTSATWELAQGSATADGGSFDSTVAYYNYGVYTRDAGSRGTNDYKCYRSYFMFDLSLESGILESATISIFMDNLGSTINDSEKAILIAATALDSGVEDHGNVFVSGTIMGKKVSDVISILTTVAYHKFTLTSEGIVLAQSAIDSGTFLTVGLVGWYNDFMGNTPLGGGEYTKFQVYYSNYIGTLRNPKMDITYAKPNATFFGANF